MNDQQITVRKLNLQRQETFRYHGRLLQRSAHTLILEAFFDRPDMQVHGLFLGKCDRFVETYFTDRWYNIFEIHARENDAVRGWYCNISCPAEINGNTISYIDLALDLLRFPDGRYQVLDEDEFARLDLPMTVRQQALSALDELKAFFEAGNHADTVTSLL